jgi:hypothetical protein
MKTLLFSLCLWMSLSSARAIGSESQTQSPKGSVGGRFQIVQLSQFAKHQHLIDTQTGRLWNATCGKADEKGECEFVYWQEEFVEDLNIKGARLRTLIKAINSPREPASETREKSAGAASE